MWSWTSRGASPVPKLAVHRLEVTGVIHTDRPVVFREESAEILFEGAPEARGGRRAW